MGKITIENSSSRILLERTDNGLVLYDVGEDDVVASRSCFEIYDRDGDLIFENIADFFFEMMSVMKFPTADKKVRLVLVTEKIEEGDEPPTEQSSEENEEG